MKMVKFPLKLETLDEITLIEEKDKIYIFLQKNNDSEVAQCKKNNKKKTYFTIETNQDKTVKILKINEIYDFKEPLDFQVHVPIQTRKRYKELFDNISYSTADQCIDFFMRNTDELHKLPFYPTNEFSAVESLSLPPILRKEIKPTEKIKLVVFDVRSGCDVPKNPDIESLEVLVGRYSKYSEFFSNFFENYFRKIPIMSERLLKKEIAGIRKSIGEHIPLMCCRSFLSIVAYYIKNGPFLMCWVPFGYDLRTNSDNYKYQRLSKYKMHTAHEFLFQDADILKIVENKRRQYISEEFDPYRGFFKPNLLDFLKKYYKNMAVNTVLNKQSESEEEDFFELLE